MTRVESHDPTVLARTLDAGAMGVIVPHVSTVEQAQAIADACRYPPRGQRSSGSGRATINAEDGARINEEVLVCPQIEDMEGVNNIEAIMAVDGIDVAFIGPNDLAAIDAILAGDKANGKPAGTPISDVAKARELVEQGFTLIDFGNDLRMLSGAAGAALKGMKA